MEYVRITSYYSDTNKWTGCEQLYFGNNQVKAIKRFRRTYPEHNQCIVVAEPYDSDNPKNREHFKACLRCGCVN